MPLPMNRRKFIKNSALAAALIGISPNLSAANDKPVVKAKYIFIFRGVAYADAFNAFKKFNISSNLSFHIQKATCTNKTYSHVEGLDTLLEGIPGKRYNIIESQSQDRFTIPQIIEDTFTKDSSGTNIVHLHHTEIGHSSTKLYIEKLEEFFTVLSKYFNPDLHKIIVTADIGLNETTNSCGGKDHSNPNCLETFALFLGGDASQLIAKNKTLHLKEVLKQKF